MTRNICGIIIGEACSTEEAKKLVETVRDCPYLIASGTTSNKTYSVYIVPEEKRCGLEYPERNPEATGLEKASVHIIEDVSFPEKISLRKTERRAKTAPCGANCQTCPLREEYDCSGCPAMIYY